jgi:hypothetical protein
LITGANFSSLLSSTDSVSEAAALSLLVFFGADATAGSAESASAYAALAAWPVTFLSMAHWGPEPHGCPSHMPMPRTAPEPATWSPKRSLTI